MINIVINSLGRGGAERSVILLAEELLRQGKKVHIVCLFDTTDEYSVSEELLGCIHRLNAKSIWIALIKLWLHILYWRPCLLFSLMPQSNITTWLVAVFLRIPFLTSERTTPTLFYRSKFKLLLSLLPHVFSRKAVFISHYALNHGLPLSILGRAVHRNACVLHNPVISSIPCVEARDSRKIRVKNLRNWVQRNKSLSPPLRLLLASRLVKGKGVLEFVESARGMLVDGSIELTLAGTGPLLTPLQALVERLGISRRMHILGFVDDIQSAFAAVDVVVLTSESEGFGRVGFEAYLAGCLVIGTEYNSFVNELSILTPAWRVLTQLTPLETALAALAVSQVPENGEDINDMREALGIEAHARTFLDIVDDAVLHN